MQENIFEPAGMKNSGYDMSAPVIEKRAAGYGKTPNGYINAPYLDMSLPYAAGSLYSTAEDLYLWDQALYGDKILSAKSRDLMFKPNLENYGYGIASLGMTLSDKITSVPVVRHSGGIHGFSTNIVRFVADKHLIVLLDNTSQGTHQGRMINAIANILYDKPYETAQRSIAETLLPIIADQGIEQAVKKYRELKTANAAEYDFSEDELNGLGYQLLQAKKLKEAGEIFKLNVEMFPEASNPYDSLGEYYAMAGQKELAIKNYKRALELNPKSTSAPAALKRLETPPATVDAKIFDAYIGQYQLAPNFILTITVENGKLQAQATGQPRVELAAISETKFRITVVDAEITFIRDENGVVTGLELFQGGRNMPAKRLP